MTLPRRNIRLTVGNVKTGNGFIVGDARDDKGNFAPQQLEVAFDVTLYSGSTPNVAAIRIYNLSEERRDDIREEYGRVILEYGYDGQYALVFIGQLYNVFTQKENGTDTITTLHCGSGLNAYHNSTTHKAFAAGASLAQIVSVLGKEMEAFGVQVGVIDERLEGISKTRGQSFSGLMRNVLDDVLRDTGITWSIENETLELSATPVGVYSEVISPANGLIGSITRTDAGLDFTTILNPAIRAGYRIKVASEFGVGNQSNLNFNQVNNKTFGEVTALVVKHTGSTRLGQATTNVVGIN